MGVEVIGAGMDWNNPYSCEQWSKKHNITYPLLDDSRGERIYNYLLHYFYKHLCSTNIKNTSINNIIIYVLLSSKFLVG